MSRTQELKCTTSSEITQEPVGIVVPVTSLELAKAALTAAGRLARDLNGIVTLALVQIVPFPLPLERPDVKADHLICRLKSLAASSTMPIRILVVQARDRKTAMKDVIPHGSLVVLATRRRWWRTAEESLARCLAADGRQVVLYTTGRSKWDSNTARLPVPSRRSRPDGRAVRA